MLSTGRLQKLTIFSQTNDVIAADACNYFTAHKDTSALFNGELVSVNSFPSLYFERGLGGGVLALL